MASRTSAVLLPYPYIRICWLSAGIILRRSVLQRIPPDRCCSAAGYVGGQRFRICSACGLQAGSGDAVILYRIRHIQTGRYLQHCDWAGKHHSFTECGCFWKKIETIQKHLKTLISEIEITWHENKGHKLWLSRRYTSVHQDRLADYEVVATEVNVQNERVIDATDLMIKADIGCES